MENFKYAVKAEKGDILLSPGEFVNKTTPDGQQITTVTLSLMGSSIDWFYGALSGFDNHPDMYEAGDIKYQVFRDSGNIFLKETRNGGIYNIVGYSSTEIKEVLKEIEKNMPRVGMEENND